MYDYEAISLAFKKEIRLNICENDIPIFGPKTDEYVQWNRNHNLKLQGLHRSFNTVYFKY